MHIVYCGFDYFSGCLEKLIDAGHRVLRVYSIEADNYYVYNQYIQAITIKNAIPFSLSPVNGDALSEMRHIGCELLITAGYLYKIPPLEPFGIKGFNIHPSLLPQGRGRWPLPWMILNDLSSAGVSFHRLSPRWDEGAILAQKAFELGADETLESLNAKMQMAAKAGVVEVVDALEVLWAQARPQVGGDYWPLTTESQRTLSWNDSVTLIDRQSRAFGKYGCLAEFNGRQYTVYSLNAWPQRHDDRIGEVVHLTHTETIVAASDGYVCLRYFEQR